MKFLKLSKLMLAAVAVVVVSPWLGRGADIVIEKNYDPLGFLKPVPVSISGFSGEADSVLKNDLLFMGIVNVAPDQAQFLISGSANGKTLQAAA